MSDDKKDYYGEEAFSHLPADYGQRCTDNFRRAERVVSDGKEVKTTIHVHHQSGRAFVLASDHDRIMSERDELWKRATKFVMPGEMDTGESIEHYIKTLEQTIAELRAEVERLKRANQIVPRDAELLALNGKFRDTIARQSRVIEKLKEAHRKNANEDFRGNRTGESIRSFKILEEIAAIETGEEE